MLHKTLRFGKGFRIPLGNQHSQVAELVMAPGDVEGGPNNCHRGSDQWLFVVSGNGIAIVNGKRYTLRPGTILLIERGEMHEIRCTGEESLRSVNVYLPPAYTAAGEELPRGRC